eukprot:2004915-Alexandrium_andersonii.AAC.1
MTARACVAVVSQADACPDLTAVHQQLRRLLRSARSDPSLRLGRRNDSNSLSVAMRCDAMRTR